MTVKMMLTEDQAVELFTFFIAAARTQLDEPSHYASMRLLSAAEMLRDFMNDRASPVTQPLLAASVDKTEHAHIIMNDLDAFSSALDDLCVLVAQYLVKQNGLEKRVS